MKQRNFHWADRTGLKWAADFIVLLLLCAALVYMIWLIDAKLRASSYDEDAGMEASVFGLDVVHRDK